ncbi:hypothetical protein CfE428DRAFT_5820 [Chthoniobacter flavus Ellin428]|uniref:Uncharacterized protein n=1 Tax=Chthoniobacter flavus Ellin428 TaxID=497964 RepID=B4DA80_9BACT|nr:hypothetical protein [Chthoniobacter flavus]EDY16707.1 hypothetical protein CfE428DRAFT_5820 [Chthoniobacter flavus Ellin428]TCO87273.1 hypothetical protein EV701_123110 [Chthoniobacter flavus]
MSFSPEQQALLNLVAKAARPQLASLAPIERAQLQEGLALILPEVEAEQCRIAAQAIRHAEDAQLILDELLEALP